MTEIFEVYAELQFSAAHSLKGYPGDCARLHGHNWTVKVYIRCRKLDEIGIGIDFRVIKENVKAFLEVIDHSTINDLAPFQDINPTSENIAKFLYKELSLRLNTEKAEVSKVEVSETPNTGAIYWEE